MKEIKNCYCWGQRYWKIYFAKKFIRCYRAFRRSYCHRGFLEVGYFEQEVTGVNRQTPLEVVWDAFPALNQAEVRAALARCGLTSKHIESQIQVLSGGEQAKVRFVC